MTTIESRRPTRLIALLAFLSLVGYALRSNITIAQEVMAPELGLTMSDMGTITAWGSLLAYALFQIPAGLLGDRFGARTVLGLAVLGWAVASFASGFASPGANAFVTLLIARILLGISQAATYPVGSMAIHDAVPIERRTSANSIFISTALIGSGLAPLTLAPLMVYAGWRAVFTASAILALVAAGLWFAFAPRTTAPRSTRTLASELSAIGSLLRNRDLVILSVAYGLHSAVFYVFIFWSFRYLVDARGFDLVSGGVWGSIPYFTAFALAPFGGRLADRLGLRIGPGPASRRVAMGCLTISALLLLAGANLPNAYLAIAFLSLSVASLNAAEGPFWTTATSLGGTHAGTAGGVLNLMGNLGGVVSTWAVPRMRDPLGWNGLLAVWAGVAVVAAILWLAVRVNRRPTA